MVSIKRIDIDTGYKGGCGNTMLSTAKICWYVNNNAKTILIDLNPKNSDISGIMTNMEEVSYKVQNGYYRWKYRIGLTVKKKPSKKTLVVIKPEEPKWGGIEFWSFIRKIIELEYNSGSTIVVDTNLALGQILPTILGYDFKDITFNFYHIWDLGAPDKPELIEKINKTIENLKETFKIGDENIIHVFNPHAAKSPKIFFSKQLRKFWQGYYKKKINKAAKIPWETIKEEMLGLNLEFNIHSEISPSRLFEPWEKFFEKLTEIAAKSPNCDKKRCAIVNILPIFEYLDLSNFVVGQNYTKNRNLKDIEYDLGKFYKYIEQFQNLRKKCGL